MELAREVSALTERALAIGAASKQRYEGLSYADGAAREVVKVNLVLMLFGATVNEAGAQHAGDP